MRKHKELENFISLVKLLNEEKNKEEEGYQKLSTSKLSHERLIIKGALYIREKAEVDNYFSSIQPLLIYDNNKDNKDENNNNTQQVHKIEPMSWNSFDMKKCSFWGCRIPDGTCLYVFFSYFLYFLVFSYLQTLHM